MGFPPQGDSTNNTQDRQDSVDNIQQVTELTLAKMRQKLLDLNKSNPLLNFRHREKSRTQIRVIDEIPDILYQRLLNDQPLFFKALPDPEEQEIPLEETTDEFHLALESARLTDEDYAVAIQMLDNNESIDEELLLLKAERILRNKVREQLELPALDSSNHQTPTDVARKHNINPDYELPEYRNTEPEAEQHTDRFIQTLLFREQMDRKLSGIRERARNDLKEKGIDTLYCAFGFLEWRESPQSEIRLLAPLLLHPATMERTIHRSQYRYQLKSTGEHAETVTNVTLAEKLKGKIELPPFEESENIQGYFDKITKLVSETPDCKHWRVRRFVTIGIFSFGRIVLYNDLNPASWPAGSEITKNPLMLQLWGGLTHDANETHETGSTDYLTQLEPLLVTDADSSQVNAVRQVLSGKNLVIHGPPGTGKSQTIANIIGAALHEGRKVLFIAEKLAALEVVQKRLSHYGLGDFCLELHSVGTNKVQLLSSLDRRLNYSPPTTPRMLDDLIKERERLKKRLDEYVELMNSRFGATDKTLHSIIWTSQTASKNASTARIPDFQIDIPLSDVKEITLPRLQECFSLLAALETAASPLQASGKTLSDFPWNGVSKLSITSFDAESIIKTTSKWLEILHEGSILANSVYKDYSLPPIENLAQLSAMSQLLGSIPTIPNELDSALLCILDTTTAIKCALEDIQLHEDYAAACNELLPYIDPSAINDSTLQKVDAAVASITKVSNEDRSLNLRNAQARLNQLAEAVQEIRAASDFVSKLSNELGIQSPSTLADAYKLIYAVTKLAQTSREVVVNLNSNVADERNHAAIDEASLRAQELIALRDRLRTQLTFDESEASDTIRQHAATLVSAGFFGRLLPKYRKSKRYFLGKMSAPGSTKTAQEMGELLRQVADCCENIQSFKSDSRLQDSLGPLFIGLTTDFDLCKGIAKYVSDTSRQLAGLDSFSTSIRRFLLDCTVAGQDACNAQITKPAFRKATKYLVSRRDSPSMERSFESEIELLQSQHDALVTTVENLTRADFHESTELSQLDWVRKHAKSILTIGQQLRSSSFISLKLNRTIDEVLPELPRFRTTVNFAAELHALNIPSSISGCLFATGYAEAFQTFRRLCSEINDLLLRESETRKKLQEEAGLDLTKWFPTDDVRNISLRALQHRATVAMESSQTGLMQWATFNKALNAVKNTAADAHVVAILASEYPLRELNVSFSANFYRELVRAAYRQFPLLAQFSGLQQEQIRQQYARYEQEITTLQRDALAARLGSVKIPPGIKSGHKRDYTDKALIDNEIGKKTQHISLRDLLDRSYRAIVAMKPCFMMSPVSAAQFIKRGPPKFDLVVIDEASQMKPEDAVSAICRGKQLVVVGDPKQLPPTTFFAAQNDGDGDGDGNAQNVPIEESILDAAQAMFSNNTHLKWHYRSKHESLIAFSNHAFYDDKLIVFPSTGTKFGTLGVRHQYVGGTYKKGINKDEVASVAKRALEIMENEPELSLGVVAMNQAQSELLNSEIDNLLLHSDTARKYRSKWENEIESFFVKNLENVQGDERDIILISTVYGPEEAAGAVAQRFGPINSATGHRRLNVLFTRARSRVELFTSMKPSDILPAASGHQGPGILKGYIEFAQSGRLPASVTTGRPPGSEFEILVIDALKSRGYDVAPQVGVAGYFIDLAIMDPHGSGTFILGVECDGATYHYSKDARDRDRVRQLVLESRGWTIHRIWSTDWFNNHDVEMKKLLDKIERCSNQFQSSMQDRLA